MVTQNALQNADTIQRGTGTIYTTLGNQTVETKKTVTFGYHVRTRVKRCHKNKHWHKLAAAVAGSYPIIVIESNHPWF